MEIRYLLEFLTLVETMSFSNAADELYISQSSLSKHIRALETELGVPLLYRTRHHVELTKYGENILPAVHSIAKAEKEIRRSIKFVNEDRLICVGIPPSMTHDRIYQELMDTDFSLEGDKVRLRIMVDDSDNLTNHLRAGTCDYAYLEATGNGEKLSEEFNAVPYKTEWLMVAMRIGHRLAAEDRIPMNQLRSENFLLIQPSSFTTKLSVSQCHKAGFIPRSVFFSHSGTFIRQLVAEGKGITFVTETSDKNLIYKLTDPPVKISVMFCSAKERVMTEKDRIFLKFVEERS